MISVCMATYNGEKFIEQQLASILHQTIQPDEVIISDDNSSDNTCEIIKNFIKKNSLNENWKLYINDTNLGYPQNFYVAMSKCKGDIVFLADQDDIWKNDKIEKMVDILEKYPKIDVLSCNHNLIDVNGEIIHSYIPRIRSKKTSLYPVDAKDILKGFHWPGMTIAYRNTFYKKIEKSLNGSNIAHDFALCITAASQEAFYFYNYIGAFHRRHSSNTGLSEHRISKLLNLDRKLRDIKVYNTMLENSLKLKPIISKTTYNLIDIKLQLSKKRYNYLACRNFCGILKMYALNLKILRVSSLFSDFWLLIFGDYKKLEK
ncbi:glycosyltransferase [Acetivibrio clariflavus]|uniref:Glycosyl transferase n=1 Tax=Acetivibrio clariflavus (strain DSM 19732 / NBRC 101661 / EBR45) TaxID=720554 RepID=G8LUH1_ACECE|nr:glycosyltransferase [Acetivibrio clariflavus]AEV70619.1 glycosyl transferase [Acetivibrio clariflavus DSM 19732]